VQESNAHPGTQEPRPHLHSLQLHEKIGSEEYFELLFDNNEFTELDATMTPRTRWVLPTPNRTPTGS
jgi:acetyl-CoA carboxylase beta subunit